MIPGTYNIKGTDPASGSSTIVDIDYADGTTGSHDLSVSDLVLTYTDDEAHKVTPRASISVDIDLWGAAGGWGQNVSVTTEAGAGAKVSITSYTMTANEYQFLIGQGGQRGTSSTLAGGFPDGGAHRGTTFLGYQRGTGGGSTRFALSSDLVDDGLDLADWNDALSDYLAIAAAGGGASAGYSADAGAGGADTGEDGGDYSTLDLGGHGGTQVAGGTGGTGRNGTGESGSKYAGGRGPAVNNQPSGTGGGGFYGGGAGAGYYGSGAGGSSFLDAGLSGTKTSGSGSTAPTGQPASYPNAGDANSLNVGYNGVAVISLA